MLAQQMDTQNFKMLDDGVFPFGAHTRSGPRIFRRATATAAAAAAAADDNEWRTVEFVHGDASFGG